LRDRDDGIGGPNRRFRNRRAAKRIVVDLIFKGRRLAQMV
jgi:hypothetical protein